MKNIKNILSIIIILSCALLCQQMIKNASLNQTNKIEYAELNHIRYGLLNIDVWKTQISAIVADEIDKLEFTKTNEQDLKKNVEAQLNVLIDQINERIKKTNTKTVSGRIKQTFIDIFVSIEDIKKGTPQYAEAMLKEIKRPRAQGQMKDLLKEKLAEYINQTFDTQDMSQVNRILLKTKTKNLEDARVKLEKEIALKYELIQNEAMALIFLSIILFLIPAFNKKSLLPPQYIMMVIALIILLIAGVTTPMIDMEAKISEMTFVLLDHHVKFENQVLFFQSKSVLDVFWVMITHETVQMKFVGILMVLFSIVFPVLKLTSSVAYYYNYRGAQKNSWINFFVLKSGKWSMADVLVVAIFMAFIGFNGIISSQFGNLKNATPDLVILTTNGTSLQPGYYVFLTYAILALFLSSYLTRASASAD